MRNGIGIVLLLAAVSGCSHPVGPAVRPEGGNMKAKAALNTKDAKAQNVWQFFRQVNRIPRCSGGEQQICRWLSEFADTHKLNHCSDSVGNIVIELGATPGYEKSPVVTLQSHVDMVCEKTPESKHDFSKDPIEIVEKDGWVYADGTTLGADNGLGVALALAVALETKLPHPKIELLFTVDEETGLTGAGRMQAGFITGKYLINLDGEDESLIVGCAGGEKTDITLKLDRAAAPQDCQCFMLKVSGLRGGHSGVDIDKQRANAIILLARTIGAMQRQTDVRICSIDGGNARNAIPRDAQAIICLPAAQVDSAKQIVNGLLAAMREQFISADPDLAVQLLQQEKPCYAQVWTPEFARRAVNLLLALPHGVERFSHQFDGAVETSNNLARVTTSASQETLLVSTFQRSFSDSCLDNLTSKITAVALLAGAEAATTGRYPGWQPDPNSHLLHQCEKVFKELRGRRAAAKVVHAGLESAILKEKFPDIETVSIGPTIKDAHSPQERLNVASVDNAWLFLLRLLPCLK